MKKLVFIVFLVVSAVIIKNQIQNIYLLWNKQGLIIKDQNSLEQAKKENEKLKQKLSLVENQSFIEEEARNKLFLGKPGESKVLIAQNLLEKEKAQKREQPSLPNWKKWLNLFFE